MTRWRCCDLGYDLFRANTTQWPWRMTSEKKGDSLPDRPFIFFPLGWAIFKADLTGSNYDILSPGLKHVVNGDGSDRLGWETDSLRSVGRWSLIVYRHVQWITLGGYGNADHRKILLKIFTIIENREKMVRWKSEAHLWMLADLYLYGDHICHRNSNKNLRRPPPWLCSAPGPD